MAGFGPVGSTPVASIGGGTGPVGTYLSPAVAVITLGGITSTPLLGLKIGKVNLAIESHPTPAAIFSKTNLAIESTLVASTSRGFVSIIW